MIRSFPLQDWPLNLQENIQISGSRGKRPLKRRGYQTADQTLHHAVQADRHRGSKCIMLGVHHLRTVQYSTLYP